jgi:hypothetical protein
MKRIGIVLLSSVALLTILTLALAQLEAKGAKYLLRVITGEDVRGYFGSAIEGNYAWNGKTPMFAISATGEANGPTRVGKVTFYDGLMSEQPALTIAGKEESILFGKVLSAGDWNGDGIPDLAVGAPAQGIIKDSDIKGKVYLYLGGSDFGKTEPLVIASDERNDGFAEALTMKSDINGDSLADLVVCAPRSAKSGATSGRAYVWFGRKDGKLAAKPDVEIKLGTTNDLFGTSVASGDVTGDGQADLIIGSPAYNVGDKMPGGVFIFHGGKHLDLTKASQIIPGEGTGFQDLFGQSVAVINDINGDKACELLVGAPQVASNGAQYGKAYLYFGGVKIAAEPNRTFTGKAEAGKFGQYVFNLGDINGDGKGDYAIQADNEAGSRGTVNFYYGGWEKEFYQFVGEAVADRLGSAVVSIGDMDGNKSPDILVGARWNDASVENGGRVYILSIN